MPPHSPKHFVLQQLQADVADADVRKGLVEQYDYNPHDAFRYLEDIKAAHPEIIIRREEQRKAMAHEAGRAERQSRIRHEILKRVRQISIGVGVFGFGLLLLLGLEAGLFPGGNFGQLLSVLPITAGPFIVVDAIMD